jgi:DHA2 family multidrug resistance protein
MAVTIMASDLSLRRPRRFDLFGLVTMTTGIVTLLLALSQGHQEGWSSSYIVWLFIIAGVSLGLFVLLELKAGDPLINLRLYRNATYAMASFAGLLLGFGMFGFHLLLPLFLQDFLNYTALQAAFLMLPGVVLSGILSPMSGKWCDRYNPRLFLVLGFLISAVSTYGFTWLGREVEEGTLIWALLLRGGLGLVFAPLAMLGLHTLSRAEISAASGLLNITRQIAGMGGIALAGVLLERWHYVHHLTGASHLADIPIEVEHVQGALGWLLHDGGEFGEALHTKTQAVLSQYLNQESLSIAFQDCFIVFTIVFLAAALAGLCIPAGEAKES